MSCVDRSGNRPRRWRRSSRRKWSSSCDTRASPWRRLSTSRLPPPSGSRSRRQVARNGAVPRATVHVVQGVSLHLGRERERRRDGRPSARVRRHVRVHGHSRVRQSAARGRARNADVRPTHQRTTHRKQDGYGAASEQRRAGEAAAFDSTRWQGWWRTGRPSLAREPRPAPAPERRRARVAIILDFERRPHHRPRPARVPTPGTT